MNRVADAIRIMEGGEVVVDHEGPAATAAFMPISGSYTELFGSIDLPTPFATCGLDWDSRFDSPIPTRRIDLTGFVCKEPVLVHFQRRRPVSHLVGRDARMPVFRTLAS